MNNCFSLRHEIEYGVPQSSILGPLLFNTGLIDLCLLCENDDITSYGDDTILYTCAKGTPIVISEPQSTSENSLPGLKKIILKQILKNVTSY